MLLDVTDLSVEYPGVGSVDRAVNALSFSVAAGEVVGLVGESGSGKSTAMLATLGLVRGSGRITGGSVLFDGRDLLHLSDEDLRSVRGREIGLVTQNPRGALNPVMRVGRQIESVYRAHEKATQAEARARALHLLESVGINDPTRRLEAYPHELSGGMAQRVLIAMALAASPRLVLADEPTSGLDVTVQVQVLDDLRRAAAEVSSSLVLVTQDIGIVANYCDRVYVLHAGEAVEQAPTGEFFARPSNPASAALLAAQRAEGDLRFRLDGFPVDGRRLPAGCFLSPRCPFALAEAGCFDRHPPLEAVREHHEVRCFRHETVLATVVEPLGVAPAPLDGGPA